MYKTWKTFKQLNVWLITDDNIYGASYVIIPEWTLPIEDRTPFKGAISYILDGVRIYMILCLKYNS